MPLRIPGSHVQAQRFALGLDVLAAFGGLASAKRPWDRLRRLYPRGPALGGRKGECFPFESPFDRRAEPAVSVVPLRILCSGRLRFAGLDSPLDPLMRPWCCGSGLFEGDGGHVAAEAEA